jgi:predicted helicase
MAELPELLKSIYRDGNNGKQFELFVKWFLTHDPEWKTHIDEVWLWDDWLGRWGRDKSIDLVFRHRDGDIWAVQAKCYASSIRITKEDMDTFLSESSRKVISRRLLMASADKMGANAREVCAGQEKPVTHFLLSDFEKAAIDYPNDYMHLNKGKPKAKPNPHDYQETAIADVAKGFKNTDRGQLIMACGTGKTFTTLWVKEKTKSKNTLVLLPSLNLLTQTAREWSFASKSLLDIRCICSNKSVGKKGADVRQSVLKTRFYDQQAHP